MKDSRGEKKGLLPEKARVPFLSPAKRREKKGEEKSGFCLLHR